MKSCVFSAELKTPFLRIKMTSDQKVQIAKFSKIHFLLPNTNEAKLNKIFFSLIKPYPIVLYLPIPQYPHIMARIRCDTHRLSTMFTNMFHTYREQLFICETTLYTTHVHMSIHRYKAIIGIAIGIQIGPNRPTWAKWGQREPKGEKRVKKGLTGANRNKQVPAGAYMGQHGLKGANRVQLLSMGPTGANQTWKKISNSFCSKEFK